VVVSHGAVSRQVLVAFDPGLGNPGTLPQDNGCFNTLDLRNDGSWTGRRSVRGPVLAGSAGHREHRTWSDHGGDRLTILGPAVGPLRFTQRTGPGRWPAPGTAPPTPLSCCRPCCGWPTRSFSPRCSAVSRRRCDHPADPGPGREIRRLMRGAGVVPLPRRSARDSPVLRSMAGPPAEGKGRGEPGPAAVQGRGPSSCHRTCSGFSS